MARPIILICSAFLTAAAFSAFADAFRAWRCPSLRHLAAVDLMLAMICTATAAFMVVVVSLAR